MSKRWDEGLDRNTKWSTYEANVQAYRSNMIASQSFLLAVGAIFFDKSAVLLAVCVVVAMVQLWYIWFRVISVRIDIVDYYKFDLGNKFNSKGEYEENAIDYLDEDVFVRNREVNGKVRQRLGGVKKKWKTRFRATRFKLDILLPASFSFIWLCMLVIKLFESVKILK